MFATVTLLNDNMLAMTYFSDVVFAMSRALVAVESGWTMLVLCIGSITGVCGEKLRDRLLGRAVWWTQEPLGRRTSRCHPK